jgi:hypothetical protein
MTRQTLTQRTPHGYQTAKLAEISRANGPNGFDFASRSQLPVERAADQALAREKSLPKSIRKTTPYYVMAGLDPATQCAHVRARERLDSGGRGDAERNCLSPAHARGLWVAGSSPAMTMK